MRRAQSAGPLRSPSAGNNPTQGTPVSTPTKASNTWTQNHLGQGLAPKRCSTRASALLAPLVQLLVASGVTYPQFTAALKTAFLRAAHAELEKGPRKRHGLGGQPAVRRSPQGRAGADLRRRAEGAHASIACSRCRTKCSRAGPTIRTTSTPTAFPRCCRCAAGLPRSRPSSSCRSRSRATFIRAPSSRNSCGSAWPMFRPKPSGCAPAPMFPREDFAKTLALCPHQSRRPHRCGRPEPARRPAGESGPFLEQSLYADELSEESVMELQRLARRIWESALRRMFALANERTPHRRTRFARNAADADALRRLLLFGDAPIPCLAEPDLHVEDSEGRQFMKSLLRILVVIVTARPAPGAAAVAVKWSPASAAAAAAHRFPPASARSSGFGSIIVNGQHYDETARPVSGRRATGPADRPPASMRSASACRSSSSTSRTGSPRPRSRRK